MAVGARSWADGLRISRRSPSPLVASIVLPVAAKPGGSLSERHSASLPSELLAGTVELDRPNPLLLASVEPGRLAVGEAA